MGWRWEMLDRNEWWLMLDDDGFSDPMGYVKKTKGLIPYKATIEHGRNKPRYFDYLTDAKRYIEEYWGIKLTKKRIGKSKWVRLV